MIRVGGVLANKIALRLTWRGCWEASAELAGPAPAGAVVIDWRGWQLRGGEVDPARSGTFQGAGRVVIIGGLRWATMLPPRFYQDDRGVLASTVAQDAADAAGLSIVIAPASDRAVGRYWPRRQETAGAVLSRLFDRAWRVDLDGITRTGARSAVALGAGVQVLSYEPRDTVIDLVAPRPDAAPLGAVVTSKRLPGPRRLVELMARADGASERLQAYSEAA